MKLHSDPKFTPNRVKECRNRPENPINRKRTNFCFEITPQKNSERKKKVEKIHPKKWKNFISEKYNIFFGSDLFFIFLSPKSFFFRSWDFFRNGIFQKYFFFEWIFSTIFFSLRIFWGCSFEAEIGPLSVYGVFRAIPALLRTVWSKFLIWYQIHCRIGVAVD